MAKQKKTYLGRQSSASPSIPRASTPVPDLPSVENIAAEDALLKQYSAVIIDVKIIESNMLNLWRQVITMMMPETSHTEGLQAESRFSLSFDFVINNKNLSWQVLSVKLLLD